MEMSLIKGKLSIKVNLKTILQKSKQEKALKMPIKRRIPIDRKKHSCAQVDLN
jgi:hypothetical protein